MQVSAAVAELPSRLATRWGARGPDASVSTSWLLVVVTGCCALAVVAVALALLVPGPSFLARRFVVGVAATAAGGAAGVWGLLAITAGTAPVPESPPAPDVEVLVPILAVLGSTALAGIAYGQPAVDPRPAAPPADLPRADLPPGQPPRWSHEAYSGFFLACVGLLVVAGALLFRVVLVGAVLCWVMAVLTLVMVRLRFDIDEHGVSLRPWGGDRGGRCRGVGSARPRRR